MYVHWKVLIGLGTLLWILLCSFDYYFIDPETKTFYYSEEDKTKWAKQDYDSFFISNTGNEFGVLFLLWNILAFMTTIAICYTIKLAITLITRMRHKLPPQMVTKFSQWCDWLTKKREKHMMETNDLFDSELQKPAINISSKIPIAVSSKSLIHHVSELNLEKDKDTIESCISLLSNSTTSLDASVEPIKSEVYSQIEKQVEKRCAKLRDEMIIQQSNSLKEHAALSRRLEHVAREKRDLCRQLVIVQKENRSTKQQLDELLAEKELLVKRLHCASKEFRDNTKSRKHAISKLEEAQTIIAELKQQLEMATNEKEVLEKKIQVLDSEHRSVKEMLSKSDSSHETFNSNSKIYVDTKTSTLSRDFKNFADESQDEVKQVENRLYKLEKSLDNLRLSKRSLNNIDRNSGTKSNENLSGNTSSDLEQLVKHKLKKVHSAEYSAVDPEEKKTNNSTPRTDNLTDEQRRKILDPIDSSGDEGYSTIRNADHVMDYTIEDSFERVGSILNYLKCAPKCHRNKLEINNYSDDTTGNEMSTTNEEEETDGWSTSTKGIVSKSPAFLKFLKKNMENSEYKEKKIPAMTRVF